ncbi:hypothetical protein KFK09_008044 [Dendrobium nobile]|uniref:Uncharacterized protein n=1 Tax=Dendrobium nobile TaxID=94219 RepID=A0A8T3BTG0_DENNO|nr:hypothetical protein KFK09_008044 [Dendrobium nobile]
MDVADIELHCQKMYTEGSTDDPTVFDGGMIDMINVNADIHQWIVKCDVSGIALAKTRNASELEVTGHFAPRVHATLQKIKQEARHLPKLVRINLHEFLIESYENLNVLASMSNIPISLCNSSLTLFLLAISTSDDPWPFSFF